ncbi:MAG TPA: hypothetical protein EYN06_04450 [Myxococcales bacterium]|nr:hypothetical protein [Myxococcales bacterium]
MRFLLAILMSALLACGAPPEDVAADSSPIEEIGPETRLMVIQTLGFAKIQEDGTAPGFDVDGVVSEEGDPKTCGHKDLISPEGTEGIDNQLASLVPLLELAGLGAAEGLLQSTIEDGGILIMIEVDGIDDPYNDDEVSVMVRAGQGVPLLGTDGLVLSGQTFDLHAESPDSQSENARIVDGVLLAGPFEARLPLVVFGMTYELTLYDAQIRTDVTDDGGLANGLMGGGVSISDLYAIGETAAKDDASVLSAIKLVVGGAGDLLPDDEGKCQRISAALEFGAVSAYFYPEKREQDNQADE